ncbi:sigma-70 domain-containing protein [Anaerosporobacter faecicola]|uniref:sigma-70 domain-containing protein n=1 Tax=Anaerosporobacter faecicola TaxID=2718714 RepID=UPI00143B9342|nr:sigma-70 domain-containing protein [Anaerosporobacter faecicola]
MQDRENFLAMLSAVVDLAKTQDNVITVDEIKELMDDSTFTQEQMGHVYEYLAANQIRIQGYFPNKKELVKTDEEKDNLGHVVDATNQNEEEGTAALRELKEREEKLEQEEAAYITMYLEDLATLAPATEGEMEILIQSLQSGKRAAKERLLELHLQQVVDIAKEYQGKGIIVGDLIQEGNIGLMTALEEIYTGETRVPTGSIREVIEYIQSRIRESMEYVIYEQRDSKILENRVVEKINFIGECMKKLAEEYGREATLEELAEFAQLEKEEVADLIELAKDELSTSKNKDEKSEE